MDGLRAARLDGRGVRALLVVTAASALLAACAGPRYASREPEPEPYRPPVSGHGLHGTDKPYEIGGRWYYPHAEPSYDEVGLASWYGAGEHNNHTTADGEVFDPYGFSAAHKTLPLPSIVEVTNLANGRTLRVRLNDRGPFVDGRLIDLSRGAAEKLGFDRQGVARVRVRYIGSAPSLAADGLMQARLTPRHAVIAPPPVAPILTASVTPAPTAAALPPIGGDDPLAALTDFRVQVGAYATREDAARAASRLGEDARSRIEPVEQPGGVLYRVVLGGYLNEDDALAAQLRFAEAGFPEARVIRPF
jgi:rare lipoprotein A